MASLQLLLCLALAGVSTAKEFFRPEGGVPVFPLVPTGGGAPASDVKPSPDVRPPPPGIPAVPSGGGGGGGGIPTRTFLGEAVAFVQSNTGKVTPCTNNADCYGYREPDDWCPLPPGGVYRDRGCWCDRAIGDCVIDRIANGVKQWAWCTDKGASKC